MKRKHMPRVGKRREGRGIKLSALCPMSSRTPGATVPPPLPSPANGEGALHPSLLPLKWLLGTWRGSGRGYYPTIEGFRYEEELRFWPVGPKPFLAYAQRTWAPGAPHALMHAETGYLRLPPNSPHDPSSPGRVELLVCDPTGVAQVYEGSVEPGQRVLELSTTRVALTTSAKEVNGLKRVYRQQATGTLKEEEEGPVRLCYGVYGGRRTANAAASRGQSGEGG